MSEKKETNKPIMDPKFAESFYTTSVSPEKSGVNYNFSKIDSNKVSDSTTTDSSWINKPYNNWSGCQYLLPCGICERTGKQCPKHGFEPFWGINFVPTCGDHTNPYFTTKTSSYTTSDKDYTEDK